MNKRNHMFAAGIFLCIMALFLCLPASAQDVDPFLEGGDDGAFAESPEGASSSNVKLSEIELVDDLINKHKEFISDGPNKDPFKPIIEKKVILPPVRPVKPVAKAASSKPAAPPVKPIQLFVQGIVGNEGQRLAIVRFENKEHTVTKEQIVDGQFKVIDIQADRVIVYSNKEQRRHTFKIGGDDKN